VGLKILLSQDKLDKQNDLNNYPAETLTSILCSFWELHNWPSVDDRQFCFKLVDCMMHFLRRSTAKNASCHEMSISSKKIHFSQNDNPSWQLSKTAEIISNVIKRPWKWGKRDKCENFRNVIVQAFIGVQKKYKQRTQWLMQLYTDCWSVSQSLLYHDPQTKVKVDLTKISITQSFVKTLVFHSSVMFVNTIFYNGKCSRSGPSVFIVVIRVVIDLCIVQ
jgi:hypothetical protein